MLILVVFAATIYLEQQQAKSAFLKEYSTRIEQSYHSSLNNLGNIASLFYKINEEELSAIYKDAAGATADQQDKIRETLLDKYMLFYDENTHLGLKQLHFHLPNGDSFLRFHRPAIFGDNIMVIRHGVVLANKEFRQVSGFEEGRFFHGFRYLYPLFYDGHHIGSFEFSFSFEAVKKELKRHFPDSHFNLLLKKEVIQAAAHSSIFNDYKTCKINPDYVHPLGQKHTGHTIDQAMVSHILHKTNIPRELASGHSFSRLITLHDNHVVNFTAIKNIRGEQAAYLVSMSPPLAPSTFFNLQFFWKLSAALVLLFASMFFWNRRIEQLNSELQDKSDELLQLSITDPLTQLANRLKMEEILDNEQLRFQRYGHPFAIVLADIDLFKDVNDNYGHQTGDSVLIQFSQLLRKSTRKTDAVARWGGEEFLLMFPETDLQGGCQRAETIRQAIENFSFEGVGRVTASFGVTTAQPDDLDSSSMISRADRALYKSKELGRNQTNGL